MQNNINSNMKSFSEFTSPTYEGVKLDLPKVISEASIMKADYVIGYSFVWKGGKGTNKDISSIFGEMEKVTIVKPVKNPDLFYGDENGTKEKYFQGQDSGKVLHVKSNSDAPLSTSWIHYKADGSPPSGAEWEDLIVVEFNKLNKQKSDDSVIETWKKFPMHHEIAKKVAVNFNKQVKDNKLVHTGKGGLSVSLGDIWRKEGAGNKTPKTDIAGASWKERISLKKDGGSRLASPEKKEAVALVKAALAHCGEQDKSFGKDLVDKMYTHMEKLATTDNASDLARRLKDGEESDATQNFKKVDEQNKELSKYLQEVLRNDKKIGGTFGRAVVWEASTGAAKFGGADQKAAANYIAKFALDGKVEYYDIKSMNSDIIKKYADSLKPYVSFKKGGGNSPAYSALQLALEQKEHKPITANRIFIEELEKEGLGSLMEENKVLLDEGILDTLKKSVKSLGKQSQKLFNKVMKAFKNALKRIKGFLKKIVDMGKEMFRKLMQFFNIDIENVQNCRGGEKFHLLG